MNAGDVVAAVLDDNNLSVIGLALILDAGHYSHGGWQVIPQSGTAARWSGVFAELACACGETVHEFSFPPAVAVA